MNAIRKKAIRRMRPLAGITLSVLFIVALVVLLGRDVAKDSATAQAYGQLYRVSAMASHTSADAPLDKMLTATVERVVDGDTIIVQFAHPPAGLDSSERLRLIGVNTPESVDPRRPVERFGKEAAQFLSRLLDGKAVLLAFDHSTRDQYGRLLAYVYTQDGLCTNLAIVEQGYGFAYLEHSFHFEDEFRKAQRTAQREGLGLWAKAD